MTKFQAIRRPLYRYITWAKSHKVKTTIIVASVLFVLFWVMSMFPKTVAYSFSGESCSTRFTFMPKWQSSDNEDLNYEYKDNVKIFGRDVLSKKICFKLAKIIDENNSVKLSLYPLDMPLLGQNYNIIIPDYPSVETAEVDLSAIPLSDSISFPLSKEDKLFEYSLNINNSKVSCMPVNKKLDCAVSGLSLKHNTEYDAAIDRIYNQEIKPVVNMKLKTIEPVTIKSTNVNNGQKLTSKVTKIILKADREISLVEGLVFKSKDKTYDVKSEIDGENIDIILPKDLPRNTDYKLTLNQIFGTSNESLPKPFDLSFTLQNGPQVVGSSLSDRATPLNSNIIIYFNQKIENTDYAKNISLTQNGNKMSFNSYNNGSSIVINPNQNFDKCASVKILFKGQINNVHEIGFKNDWQQTSIAKCATNFSIGKSVSGRSIVGYKFGNGNNEILYVGALHGDENNSKRILEEWMWELEGNPSKIPNNTTVTVIPSLNPDGTTSRSRYNTNGVDLNRNFPANNWKSDIVVQDGSTKKNGGGTAPLSEPESSAIANYISNKRPKMVLTYHSQGNIVESNEAGIANNYSQKYSSISGYGYKAASSNAGFFKYDINGSLEEWAKDKLGQPVILVELSTRIYHDFSRNKNAMWAMLQ